jgi:hypothetical protein
MQRKLGVARVKVLALLATKVGMFSSRYRPNQRPVRRDQVALLSKLDPVLLYECARAGLLQTGKVAL